MNQSIDRLPIASTLTGSEVAPLVQSGGNVQATLNAMTTSLNVPIAFILQGKPTTGRVYNYVLTYAVMLPANFAGTVIYDSTQATANAVFTVNKISSGVTTAIGMITITSTTHTSCTLSTQAAVMLSQGDVLQVVAPTQDATLADIGITFLATQINPSLDLNFMTGTLDPSIAFTRASTATYFDATGTLQTATTGTPRFDYGPTRFATNLAIQSSAMTNVAWTASFCTLTAAATTAPDGTTTGVFVKEDSSTNQHFFSGTVTLASATQYTVSIYAKASTRHFLLITGIGLTAAGLGPQWDVTAGTDVSNGTAAGFSHGIQNVGSGWYRCWFTFTSTTSTNFAYIMGNPINISTYAGDGASGLYVWGAQVEASAVMNPYIPTTTIAASVPLALEGVTNGIRNSTMVGAVAGTPGTLPTNWAATPPTGLTRTISLGTMAGIPYIDLNYTGTTGTTASFFFDYELNAFGPVASSGQTWTESQYLALPVSDPSITNVFGILRGTNGVSQTENPSTVNILGSLSSSVWFRLVHTATLAVATTTNANQRVQTNVVTSGTIVNVTFRIGGPQLEMGLGGGVWIPTTNAAVNVGAVPLGLLIEEARTNSIRNNTMVGTVAGTPGTMPTNWSVNSLGLTSSVIGSGTENGISYVDIRLNGTTTSVNPSLAFETLFFAAIQNQIWTNSFYLKLTGGTLSNVTGIRSMMFSYTSGPVFLNSFLGTPATPTSAPLASQRVILTATLPDATTAFVKPFMQFLVANGVAVDFTFRVGLPQLELGGFATSAIPTSTVAVTRAIDAASASIGSWYNTQSGTGQVEWMPLGVGGSFGSSAALVGSNSGTDYIMFEQITIPATAPREVGGGIFAGSVSIGGNQVPLVSLPFSTVARSAFAWALGGTYAAGYNGTSYGPSGSITTLPTIVSLHIMGNTHFQPTFTGYMRRIRVWPRALSTTELALVTR